MTPAEAEALAKDREYLVVGGKINARLRRDQDTRLTVAAALNQTSTIFALILAALILKEPFIRRKFVSTILALTGVMLVTLYDRL